MYIRPLLLGTGGTLGLAPAPEVTFVVYSAAVGSYFVGGNAKPIQLKVEDKFHRAAPLGVGAAKCAGASAHISVSLC
jgi:branched-chain amino acid aminotransferase